jgi:hypothetical protein
MWKLVDPLSTHGLSCKVNKGKFTRHAILNDILHRALISADIPSVREPVGLFRNDGKRPDGMTLIPWRAGKSLLWDITIVHPLSMSYIRDAIKEQGKVAHQAELRKIIKYKETDGNQFIFTPIAIETLGILGPEASKCIDDIGRRLIKSSGDKRSRTFLKQSISLNLQRGNALCIIDSLPRNHGLIEIDEL